MQFSEKSFDVMKNRDVIGRINELIAEFSRGKYSVFAGQVGVAVNAVKGWREGKSAPALDSIRSICDRFEVTPNWLIYGWQPKFAAEKRPAPEALLLLSGDDDRAADASLVVVPILNQAAFMDASRGITLVSPATTDGFMVANRRADAHLIGVPVVDDSMSPEIESGDVIVVDTFGKDQPRRDGELILLDAFGYVSPRRYVGDLALSNDARRFGPIKVKPRQILGVVVEIRRNVERIDDV